MTERCHCGKPLHYTDKAVEDQMRKLEAYNGRYVHIICEGKTYNVCRHYIALHGVKGRDLNQLGFEEIT